jgi:hypothetical protein
VSVGVELGQLGGGVGRGADEAGADDGDDEGAGGGAAGDQVVAAGLGTVVPELEQAELAAGEVGRDGPQVVSPVPGLSWVLPTCRGSRWRSASPRWTAPPPDRNNSAA